MTRVVRNAEPRDYFAIEVIENAADQLLVDRLAPERWDAAPPASTRAEQPGFLLVAEEAKTGALVGFVHVLELNRIAHLEQLSVLPTHGRRGHGRGLVHAALAEARARGHVAVTLRTYADVPWNAPFYASVGFVETEPTTEFHQQLVETEERLGLGRYGRRIQMTATFPAAAL